jgi:hypothetical protein
VAVTEVPHDDLEAARGRMHRKRAQHAEGPDAGADHDVDRAWPPPGYRADVMITDAGLMG